MSTAAKPVADSVSVVIPTTGGPVLDGCFQSLTAGRVWPARVIVVDQGPPGDVLRRLDALRASGMNANCITMPRRGISAATNRGLADVTTPFVAVTHDDCRVHTDWLERIASRLPALGEAVLTGRVEPDGDGVVLTIKTAPAPEVYTAPPREGAVLFPPNMAFPVRVLQRAGWFDEHPSLATAGEDNEWAHRVLKAGVPIVYDPEIAVGHLARFAQADLRPLYKRYARGQGAFYGKWIRRGDFSIARRAVWDLIRGPWLLAKGLATRNSELIAIARGQVEGLPAGILAGLGNKERSGRR